MAETINISRLAGEISNDIFKIFKWHVHPHKDENFFCVRTEEHFPKKDNSSKNSANATKATNAAPAEHTHPTDVVFDYFDPYLGKRIYLLSDLKSYSKGTLKSNSKIRSSLISLAKSIDCADVSQEWKSRYVIEDDPHEVRGLLFVYNHDAADNQSFTDKLAATNFSTLPLKKDRLLHVLGPDQISHLLSITTDIARLQLQGKMGQEYTFLYPDLVQWKRKGEIWDHAATAEALTAPFLIIMHRRQKTQHPDGYVIYYSGPGKSFSEFIFLIDTLSRFQVLGDKVPIALRMTKPAQGANYLNNLEIAKKRYIQGWSMDDARKAELDLIEASSVQVVVPRYSALDVGWRD